MITYKYTVTINHGEYAKGVFDTEEQAIEHLETELSRYCSDEVIANAKEADELSELADGYGFHLMDIQMKEETKEDPLKLVDITVRTNYGTKIESRFLATERDIQNHKTLIGRTLDFGEYEGKHSEVEGEFREEDMTVADISPTAAQVILDNVGKRIAGENLFDFFNVYENFYEPLYVIKKNLEKVLSTQAFEELEDTISKQPNAQKKDGKYDTFRYMDQLEKQLPLAGLEKWSEQLEDDYEEIASDLPEDLQKELTEWLDEALL